MNLSTVRKTILQSINLPDAGGYIYSFEETVYDRGYKQTMLVTKGMKPNPEEWWELHVDKTMEEIVNHPDPHSIFLATVAKEYRRLAKSYNKKAERLEKFIIK